MRREYHAGGVVEYGLVEATATTAGLLLPPRHVAAAAESDDADGDDADGSEEDDKPRDGLKARTASQGTRETLLDLARAAICRAAAAAADDEADAMTKAVWRCVCNTSNQTVLQSIALLCSSSPSSFTKLYSSTRGQKGISMCLGTEPFALLSQPTKPKRLHAHHCQSKKIVVVPNYTTL